MNESSKGFASNQIAWWLHPIPVFLVLNGLTAVSAYFASRGTYLELWGEPKYVDGSTVLLTVGIILAFSLGVWLASAKVSAGFVTPEWQGTVSFSETLLLFNISFWVCTLAYVFWVGLALSRGLGLSVLKSIFVGGDVSVYTLRTFFETVPGITTWTQAGIAAVILGCLIGAGGGWRLVRIKIAILMFLAVARAVIYSERLAFLELAVPFLVLWLAESRSWKHNPALRTLVRIAPVLGAVVVYAVFTGFETLRSWSIYYSSRESSLLLFGLWRLVGYYITSLNNSMFLMARLHHPVGAPYFSFGFLWEFPGLKLYVRDLFSWVHLNYDVFMGLLEHGANPEFNNPGGLLSPVVDFGPLGGLAYWAVMGLATGSLYSLYIRKHPLGLCIYPIVFLTLTEIPRYIYWGEGRAFPALAYLLLSVIVLLRSARFSGSRIEENQPPVKGGIAVAAPAWK